MIHAHLHHLLLDGMVLHKSVLGDTDNALPDSAVACTHCQKTIYRAVQ